ncbi:hypothetical protein [Kitasatospora aureofaciens]|uniref:hypothetical protein n=1 Tax=Kitasatospora aureofaciens TaxID=1894 RepID=UPI000524986E|nr:hypothetical protein [Kitasatospora aureofaciens]
MEEPAHTQPAHYALASIHTDYRFAGMDGPALLTGDAFLAAHFFLQHDRAGFLDVITDSAAGSTELTPCRPDEILERALRELDQDDPRRTLLDHAQAQWLASRLYPPGDREEWQDDEPSWARAGTAWGAAFGPLLPLPEAQVLDRLADLSPPGQEGRHAFSWAAFATARAIRQAGTPAVAADPNLLRANAQLLAGAPHREAAVRAAAQWYLEHSDGTGRRLTARPAAFEQGPGQEDSATRQGLGSTGTQTHARALLENAARDELDHWGFDEQTREHLENDVVRSRRSVDIHLPDPPASDAQAALLWRSQVPSAAREGRACDQLLGEAFTYAAQAPEEAKHGTRLDAVWHVEPAILTREVEGRHAVLGRLFALAQTEEAARALEPGFHDAAQRAAEAASERARARGLQPWAVHAAGQAAHLHTYDTAKRDLDRTLEDQRRTARATVAAYYPRPAYGLREDLFRGVDGRALEQAHQSYTACTRQLEYLTAQAADPHEAVKPSDEDLAATRQLTENALQRWTDLRTAWPATQAAMRAFGPVMDLPAPTQPAHDGLERLSAHRRKLTDRLTERLGPAPAPATRHQGPAAEPRPPARPHGHQQTATPAPSAPQRGVR